MRSLRGVARGVNSGALRGKGLALGRVAAQSWNGVRGGGGVLAPPRKPRAEEETKWQVLEGWPPHGGGGDGQGGGRGGGGGGRGGDGDQGGSGDPGSEGSGDAHQRRVETAAFGVGLWMCALAISFGIVMLATWALRNQDTDRLRLPAGIPVRLTLSTLCLLASSLALELGQRRLRCGREAAALWLLHLAQGCALGFLFCQALAWQALLRAGIRPDTSALGTTFTTLTALHALHILGGLFYLFAAARRLRHRGPAAQEVLHLCARYWHFLGLLWIAILLALVWLF